MTQAVSTGLQTLPETHSAQDNLREVCLAVGNKVVPCPSCPSDPWLVLAKLTPNSGSFAIEYNDRRILMPTAMMVDKCSTL
jgi:hypothetical protein